MEQAGEAYLVAEYEIFWGGFFGLRNKTQGGDFLRGSVAWRESLEGGFGRRAWEKARELGNESILLSGRKYFGCLSWLQEAGERFFFFGYKGELGEEKEPELRGERKNCERKEQNGEWQEE